MKKPILIFDMDGVLVDVTESYRETIAQHRGAFHRTAHLARAKFRITRTRAAGTTIGCSSHDIIADRAASMRPSRK